MYVCVCVCVCMYIYIYIYTYKYIVFGDVARRASVNSPLKMFKGSSYSGSS